MLEKFSLRQIFLLCFVAALCFTATTAQIKKQTKKTQIAKGLVKQTRAVTNDFPHRETVLKFLQENHPELRLAEDADFPNKRALAIARKELGNNYHPFRAASDFNRDGKTDLAIIFVVKGKTEKAVAIFNDIGSKPIKAAYFAKDINNGDAKSTVSVYFNKADKDLLLGDYVTMGGGLLKPSGDGYVYEELP